MNAKELIVHLSGFDIDVYMDDNGKLKAKSPKGAITSDIANLIKSHKACLIDYLMQFDGVISNGSVKGKIRPVERSQTGHQVSFAQQRLWFIDQMQGQTPEYNMPKAFSVQGDLDVSLLAAVINQIIQRHEVLRTVYVEELGEVKQIVRAPADIEFCVNEVDFTDLTSEMQQSAVQEYIAADTVEPFDLARDIMLRVSYLQTAMNTGVLVFNMHHIASDGWSMEVLTKEFFALYEALSQGKPNPLAKLPIQYVDYAHWQRTQMADEVLDKQLDYWAEQLNDLPMVHNLPLSNPRPEVKAHAGEMISCSLPSEIRANLQTLAKQLKVTPFMLLHGALSLLLSRHSNCKDVVIGTPVANRMHEELTPLIGFFINTLVLKVDTHQNTLSDYFHHVRQVHLDAQSNQDVPFDKLVERLNIPRSTAHTPLFQIMITTNTDYGVDTESNIEEIRLSEATLKPLSPQTIQAKFDLEVNMRISAEGVGIDWTYDVALFNKEFVQGLSDNLCRLLSGLCEVEHLDVAPHKLPILSSEASYNLISELNCTAADYPKDMCIHELFEQQALDNPDSVAVIFEHASMTYSVLNERANKLAHYLVDKHEVKPDTLVGLCVERSLEMIVGILAILKAGGAYVPLDPSYPQGRIDYMIEDAGLTTILGLAQLERVLEGYTGQVICIEDEARFQHYSGENLIKSQYQLTSCHLAYMIYTSGSTGRPKGVMIEHQSVSNYLSCVKSYLTDNIEFSFMSTSLNFDATVTSLFGSWLKGKYVEVLGREQDAFSALQASLEGDVAGLYKVTPTHLKGLSLAKPTLTPHVIVVGGEALSRSLAVKMLTQMPNAQFINEYGPTEATVGCSYHKFCYTEREALTKEHSIHIGKPICNSQFYVMGRGEQLLPKGTLGELYIGGDGLARGYFNRPELTAERFVKNPYYNKADANSSERLYRTGDLVRYLADGSLEFVGRIDDQVKIRGFRIELGEIEAQIALQPGVDSTVVLAKDLLDSQQLVGYIKPTVDLNEFSRARLLSETKSELYKQLPDYMVPNALMLISEWPLTPNGKVDINALPQPDGSVLQGEYIPPETDTEKVLVEIWAQILEIDMKKISVTADFFELGGHSLLVMKKKAIIQQKFDVSIEVAKLFDCPTIKLTAETIDSKILKTKIELVSDKIEEDEVELLI
ncbi:amino acid adenylation domain-containing protein [Pseudoalteromonas piscicida]|uniref:non-ribosomal peptide synthetase n=1 Tax=Pseudoalteromonas piscicida TaxID=43662 RepID=UPI002738E6AA|nr:amino acid adenylation domain-containing protein [Pseudoalteromonas piscicida]MDP4489535.1 amino acid adenylation domain-containing protein [Pseudoalteromonas piscicida]